MNMFLFHLNRSFIVKKLSPFLLLLIISISCTQPSAPISEAETFDVPECIVSRVPDSLGLDSFYVKYVDVNGLPLVSSWRVPDSAFVAAHRTLYAMTCMLKPEVLQAMIKAYNVR